MRKLLIILMLILSCGNAWGACSCVGNTCTAGGVDVTDMDACVTAAESLTGDVTIIIPSTSGTKEWSTQFAILSLADVWDGVDSITIQGDGTTSTVIKDTCAAGTPALKFGVPSGKFLTLKSFKIINDVDSKLLGPIWIYGGNFVSDAHRFRVTDLACESGGAGSTRCLYIGYAGDDSNIYGLIDSSTFTVTSTGHAIRVFGGGTTTSGDGTAPYSWANTTHNMGGSEYVFIENNTFNFTTNQGDGAYDSYAGARIVFRYNDIEGTHLGSHGNEATRSAHDFEIYNNAFTTDHTSAGVGSRGGSGILYNNTFTSATSAFTSFSGLQPYRSCPYFRGTHTGENNAAALTDGNITTRCAPNGFNTGGTNDPYCLNGTALSGIASPKIFNLTDGSYCTIASNTDSTITCTLTGGTDNNWDAGDEYAVSNLLKEPCTGLADEDGNTVGMQGYPCNQQCGRTTGTPGNLTPGTLAPIYYWSNTFQGDSTPTPGAYDTDKISGCALGLVHIVADRDYFYQGDSFDGTSGVGVGLDAAKPATCSSVNGYPGPGYWATDTKKLYRCSAENTWTQFYAPSSCPHVNAGYTGYACDSTKYGKGGYPGTGSGEGTTGSGPVWTLGTGAVATFQ